jgi:methionine-rich copper-binding protein CopC
VAKLILESATNPSSTTTQVATTPVNPVDTVARDLAAAALQAAQVPPKVSVDISATTTTTTTQSKVGLQFSSTQSTFETNLGEKVIDTSLISNIRSKNVYFSAYHLKPLTELHAFFDNINVDAYIAPAYRVVLNKVVHTNRTKSFARTNSNCDVLFAKGKTIYITQSPIDSGAANGYLAAADTFTWDSVTYTVASIAKSDTLTTDENGYIAGTFMIPNNSDIHFNTGSRAFLLCDSVNNNAAEISTSAEFMYYASGMAQTKQAQTLSTRINQVTINPLLKSASTETSKTVAYPTAKSAVAPVTILTDTTAPTIVSYSPSKGATGVAVGNNIIITFSENVTKYTGSITLKKSNGTVIETFAMPGSSLVTISGAVMTINPTADLNHSTSYIIDLPYACVQDGTGNSFAAVSDYSFTTSQPAATSALVPVAYFPSDGSLDIDVSSKVSIQFNRAIAKGTGNLVLRTTAGTVETINTATSTNVTIVNDTITIAFTNLLSKSTNYYLDIPSTAIKDTAGSPVFWVGTTTYDFTTISSVQAVATSGYRQVSRLGELGELDVYDYILDFTTATGECGFDITTDMTRKSISAQLFWDGNKVPVAGTGGSLDKPCFVSTKNLPIDEKFRTTRNFVGATFATISQDVSSSNPLKYRFNKTKANPTTAILRITSAGPFEWNQVLPASVTPVEGKANFKTIATGDGNQFSPVSMDGTTGWEHWYQGDYVNSTRDVSGNMDHANWNYKDASGKTQKGLFNGFIAIPAGSKTLSFKTTNSGTASGTVTSIAPTLNTLDNTNIVNATPTVSDKIVHSQDSNGKWVMSRPSGFPITIPAGGYLTYNITFTWPFTYWTPTWDWNTETGLTGTVRYNAVVRLPNKDSIIAKFQQLVTEKIRSYIFSAKKNPASAYLSEWDLLIGYTNDDVLPNTSKIYMNSWIKSSIVQDDPLAQTFFIDSSNHPDGYFVSSVDLFFKQKSTTEDITVQIRPVINGFPSSSEIVPFAISSLTPDSVNLTSYPDATDSSSYTKFKFDSPIYLTPGTYAIVVISASKDYSIFTSTVGGFRLSDLDSRIAEIPYTGDLFKSSNSQTWLPSPYQDMCFVINRADFSASGTVAFKSDKPVNNYSLAYNTFQAVTHYNINDYIRVQSSTNTDRVYQVMNSGTSGASAPTHTTGTVTNGTISLQFIATATRWQDTEVPYDVYFAQGENVLFKNSEAKHYYKGTNSSGVLDTDFKEIMIGSNYEMESRKVLDSNVKDIYSKIELSTNDSKLSPIIDLTRLSNVLVRNLINADTIAPDFVANTDVTSGDYIKVLVGTTYRMYLVITSGTTSTAAPVFVGGDILNGTALLRYVGETNNGDTELLPAGGTALSRYMTRKVVLADGFESTDIVVRFNAYTPIGSTVKVYYKAAFVDGNTTLEESPYHEMVLSERDANYAGSFVEHKFICDYGDNILPGVRYALPNKQRFNQFSIKIVMLSANTVVVPKIRDLRVMALDD